MARLWVDTLMVQNPDYGFAYGGYEYSTVARRRLLLPHVRPVSLAPGLQLHRLRLSALAQIRRGVGPRSKKSLQDWDFWIRVVKTHNVKGYYIDRDLTFYRRTAPGGGLEQRFAQQLAGPRALREGKERHPHAGSCW
jgi:hypothetical protein